MLRFSIEKWHFDGDPRRGFELYHHLFHALEVLKNIVWNGELWWVMLFLASKVSIFALESWFDWDSNSHTHEKTKKKQKSLPVALATELSKLI